MSTANSDYNESHVFALALCMSIYTPDRNQEKDNKMIQIMVFILSYHLA